MAAAQKILFAVFFVCAISCALCQQPGSSSSNNNNSDSDVTDGRTFGHHFLKRMSFALVPGAFVIGVITTLLAALTVVSMKGLGVGVILLVLAIGQMLSRTIPHVHAATAYSAPAPVPIVYSHAHTQQPVFLEKDW